jgi:hypothetical protein
MGERGPFSHLLLAVRRPADTGNFCFVPMQHQGIFVSLFRRLFATASVRRCRRHRRRRWLNHRPAVEQTVRQPAAIRRERDASGLRWPVVRAGGDCLCASLLVGSRQLDPASADGHQWPSANDYFCLL